MCLSDVALHYCKVPTRSFVSQVAAVVARSRVSSFSHCYEKGKKKKRDGHTCHADVHAWVDDGFELPATKCRAFSRRLNRAQAHDKFG